MKGDSAQPSACLKDELRSWGQPYLAYYALSICVLVLCFSGWASLVAGSAEGKIIIAEEAGMSNPGRPTHGNVTMMQQEFPPDTVISSFIAAYIPIPVFLLLIFGYNLIDRTPATTYGFARHEEAERISHEEMGGTGRGRVEGASHGEAKRADDEEAKKTIDEEVEGTGRGGAERASYEEAGGISDEEVEGMGHGEVGRTSHEEMERTSALGL